MIDLSEPVAISFIIETIGIIFLLIAIGIYFVKQAKKEGEKI